MFVKNEQSSLVYKQQTPPFYNCQDCQHDVSCNPLETNKSLKSMDVVEYNYVSDKQIRS